jgi:P27 family predicted phage terminase small subunit
MAMVGRKVVPIEIKKARGTYRKDRDKKAPTASRKRPLPPAWLNTRAKQIFWHMVGRLKDVGLASRTHTESLALLCSRLEEIERLDRYLSDPAITYTCDTFNAAGKPIVRLRPEVELRREAMRHAHALLAEFGLTPASRQKVGGGSEGKKPHNTFGDLDS